MNLDSAAHHDELSKRDALLRGVAEAAQLLLASADFDAAVNGALEAIATTADIDRIYIFENQLDPKTGAEVAYCPYEWTVPGIVKMREIPNRFPMVLSLFGRVTQELRAGRSVQVLARELPEPARALQALDTAVSLSIVPIVMSDGTWWGAIGCDDCTTERVWSDAEVAVLETAAACIGSAIERDRARAEREAAAQVGAAELETHNQQLRERDSLLNCVNAAAQCLVANDDLSVALPAMLQILGEGTGQCRAYILQLSLDDRTNEHIFSLVFEWDAPDTPSKPETGGRFPCPLSTFPERLTAPLKAGRATRFLARELDGISPEARRPGQARSLVGVPITVVGEWWGLLGLDNCLEERIWSDAEIIVLETAATVIGNAVERDRSRRAREAAEREILIAQERAARAAELEAANRVLRTRDRWLQTIAAAASELLSAAQPEVSVNTALQLIGENLECDRLCVMRYLPATEGAGGFGYFQLLYEWNAPGTISHMASEGMQTMPANDFADWTARLMAGEAVGGLAVEQGEPFRGSMLKLGALYAYAIPIFVGAEAGLEFWGVMFIDYCRETQLTPAEIAVFDTAATCVGSAIHREQMQRDRAQAERNALLEREREKAARARVAELARTNEAISKTLTTLAASPELDLFLGHILAEMAQKLGACKAHLFLYDRLANTLTQRVTVQDGRVYLGAAPRDPEMFARPIPADITPGWKYIIDSAKPLTHDENGAYDEEIWWPEALAWHKSQGHRAITCIPMKAGKQPVGFIGFCFYERIAFTDEQFEFMQALANQAIVAIQLTRLAEQSKNTALTDERNRLAREIHDTLAQAFTGISLQLEAVRGLTRKASAHPLDAVLTQAQPYIRRARDLARQGLSEARRSVRALRSEALETDTLPDALRKALAQTHRDTGLSTHFYLEGEPSPLPDDIQLNLLRIAQEAITNTLRHAQATQLDLTLSFTPRQVQLRIVDDGVGFDPVTLMEKTGFGIIGIRERTDYFYGTFNLQSTPNIGTTLEVLIPL